MPIIWSSVVTPSSLLEFPRDSMEQFSTFPSNKRHGMHFHHQTPTENFITAQFPNPKTGRLSPSNVSISTFRTPETIDEALALSQTPPSLPPHSSKNTTPTRQPLPRSQSSSWWMEIRKNPTPRQGPRSRKTSEATIRTDATATQPAFESDAFAVHMPATREPIIDPPGFRAKLPSPSRAQVEAYQTYKRKAQQVREKQKSEGVRIPSKIISYDYAHTSPTDNAQPLELDVSPPSSPPDLAPAGSFPASPPIAQHGWARPAQVQGPRSMSDSGHNIARKPVGMGIVKSNDSRPKYYQARDTDTGASLPTRTPKPSTIKIRIKPKTQDFHESQKEKDSWWSLYSHSPQTSTDGSRSPSPTRSNFAYTTPTEAVFGFGGSDATGTVAGASKSMPIKASKSATKSTSRWAWLRPTGPRVTKPTATQTTKPAVTKTSYINPFTLHTTPALTQPNTPAASRPASPKKLARTQPLAQAQVSEKGKFESGFAQITSFTSLALKLCLVVYALVGLYFVLDAIREAVHALGAPFRGIKLIGSYVWVSGVWMLNVFGKTWER